MKSYCKLVLLGDGWGAISAYKSLSVVFKNMAVVTCDEDLKQLAPVTSLNLLSLKKCILIFAGYKPIVSKEVLQNNICINIHYSLLPTYRGMHSTVWAILNDEEYLGLSIHLMSEYIDDGDIIHQYKIPNDFQSTSTYYMEQFNQYIEKKLSRIILEYLNGNITPYKQNKLGASWVGKRNMEDCKVDFSRPISYQKAFFRALVVPYPLPYITFKEENLIVSKVGYYENRVVSHIGRILNIDNEGIWVKCQDGYLIIKELLDKDNNVYPHTNFKIGMWLNKS